MKTFKLINGDIIFKNGGAVMIEGVEALAQRLANGIKLDRGSWFLDVDKGIEWLQILGGKSIRMRFIHARIQNILKNDSEVTAVNYIDIKPNRAERVMKISFGVNSIYGETKGDTWITE